MRAHSTRLAVASALVLVIAACNRDREAKPLPAPTPGPGQAAASNPGQPGVPKGLTPLPPIKGKVLEKIDSAGYTYLRLETPQGSDGWAAVGKASVKVGDEVTIVNASRMDGFTSKTLNRTFKSIVFGALPGDALPKKGAANPHAGVPGAPPVGAAAGAGAKGSPGAQTPKAEADIKVEPATGEDGRTVAALMAKAPAEAGKTVAVHGKVVKFSPKIMGRNWLHLQDGTGSAADKTHDLTVTTNDVAAVGDVVLVRGVVRHDKNFGAGYAYPVLLEEAKIEKP